MNNPNSHSSTTETYQFTFKWFELIALHLFPGIMIGLFYYILAWLFTENGINAYFALMLIIAIVLVPLELGIISFWSKKTTGKWSVASVLDFRKKIGLVENWIYPPFLFICVGIISFAISPLSIRLVSTFTPWVPEWVRTESLIHDIATCSSAQRELTLIFGIIFSGMVAPIVEEIYFRGFLLPKMASLGKSAPVLNTLLFAIYHFYNPWNILPIFLVFLPINYVVWIRKNITISIVTHCMINLWGVYQVFFTLT